MSVRLSRRCRLALLAVLAHAIAEAQGADRVPFQLLATYTVCDYEQAIAVVHVPPSAASHYGMDGRGGFLVSCNDKIVSFSVSGVPLQSFRQAGFTGHPLLARSLRAECLSDEYGEMTDRWQFRSATGTPVSWPWQGNQQIIAMTDDSTGVAVVNTAPNRIAVAEFRVHNEASGPIVVMLRPRADVSVDGRVRSVMRSADDAWVLLELEGGSYLENHGGLNKMEERVGLSWLHIASGTTSPLVVEPAPTAAGPFSVSPDGSVLHSGNFERSPSGDFINWRGTFFSLVDGSRLPFEHKLVYASECGDSPGQTPYNLDAPRARSQTSSALGFSADGRFVAIRTSQGLKVRDLFADSTVLNMPLSLQNSITVAISSNGEAVAVGYCDGQVKFFYGFDVAGMARESPALSNGAAGLDEFETSRQRLARIARSRTRADSIIATYLRSAPASGATATAARARQIREGTAEGAEISPLHYNADEQVYSIVFRGRPFALYMPSGRTAQEFASRSRGMKVQYYEKFHPGQNRWGLTDSLVVSDSAGVSFRAVRR